MVLLFLSLSDIRFFLTQATHFFAGNDGFVIVKTFNFNILK